jgi:septal ring factor EnvC (AmiA/AmiB activator)
MGVVDPAVKRQRRRRLGTIAAIFALAAVISNAEFSHRAAPTPQRTINNDAQVASNKAAIAERDNIIAALNDRLKTADTMLATAKSAGCRPATPLPKRRPKKHPHPHATPTKPAKKQGQK